MLRSTLWTILLLGVMRPDPATSADPIPEKPILPGDPTSAGFTVCCNIITFFLIMIDIILTQDQTNCAVACPNNLL